MVITRSRRSRSLSAGAFILWGVCMDNRNNPTVVTIELLKRIKQQYRLPWHGTHGVIHWNRVYENGIKLAEQDGVNTKVVQFFSIFHDSQRKNEGTDNKHGNRGAKLALKMRDDISLDDDDFSLLITACSLHTSASTHDDITVQACFDSDRLDLGRVGTMPDIIKWGYSRSLVHDLPGQPFGLSEYNGGVIVDGGI